mmetsp:Transcript_8582/g.24695  ORF Transcript_8582/g.24695 Transcript_8582/m.24695 type:complete len:348 (+) Transcript_8582:413-1456(+)
MRFTLAINSQAPITRIKMLALICSVTRPWSWLAPFFCFAFSDLNLLSSPLMMPAILASSLPSRTATSQACTEVCNKPVSDSAATFRSTVLAASFLCPMNSLNCASAAFTCMSSSLPFLASISACTHAWNALIAETWSFLAAILDMTFLAFAARDAATSFIFSSKALSDFSSSAARLMPPTSARHSRKQLDIKSPSTSSILRWRAFVTLLMAWCFIWIIHASFAASSSSKCLRYSRSARSFTARLFQTKKVACNVFLSEPSMKPPRAFIVLCLVVSAKLASWASTLTSSCWAFWASSAEHCNRSMRRSVLMTQVSRHCVKCATSLLAWITVSLRICSLTAVQSPSSMT